MTDASAPRTPRPVAVVTGGNRGIGLAIARQLAEAGFDLFLTGLEPEAAVAVESLRARGGVVAYVPGDIADARAQVAWVDALRRGPGRVDCLVNNAGMGAVARGDLLDLAAENLDRVLDVNLKGTVFLTHALVRLMLAQPPGPVPRAIVNITSISASHASPDRIDYCMSKAALALWSQGLALRLAETGIAVFDVRPGIIRSDMTAGVTETYDRLIAEGLVPARRWGEGDDVAKVVAALASGAFAFATGSVIGVDGGLSIGRL